MESWTIITDIVVLLTAALVVSLIFERLRQSSIVGCLVAGTLVGPYVLNWVRSDQLGEIAELGVSLLLFTIGLEFSWRRVRSMGSQGLVGGLLQIVVTLGVVALVSRVIGLSWTAAFSLGAIVSLSSTATVLRVLQDRGEIDSMHGRLSMTILLVQDAAVVPLVLLVTFLGGKGGFGEVMAALGTAVGRAALLVVGLIVVGTVILPRVLNLTAYTRNRELPVILAIVTWLASTWAAHSLGLSAALGAFVAGMLMAESPFATQVRSDVAPFRIAFVTLFFASLGLLADLSWLAEPKNLMAVAGVVIAIGVGKAAIIWAVVRPLGRPNRECLAAGLALGQIGEFSFVLAAIAMGARTLSEHVFQLVVCSTLVTLVLTPFLVSRSSSIARRVEAVLVRAGLWKRADFAESSPRQMQTDHVIVVGFGPAGQAVVRNLLQAEFDVLVLELNPRSVFAARSEGIPTLLADASRRETLEEIGLDRARACVLTVPHHEAVVSMIEQIRAMSPTLPIIARARYHAFAEMIRDSGVTIVVDEEVSVGQELARQALRTAFEDAVQRAG